MVAVALLLPACEANPAFKIRGASGSETGGDSGEVGESGDEAGTTGEPVCTPRVVKDVSDACTDWRPSPVPTPNLADAPMLAARPCEEPAEMYVIRDGQFLYETAACDRPYDASSSMNLEGALLFPGLEDLPPVDGGCARFWHLGKRDVDGAACISAAYAFWDGEDEQRLRFAYSSASEPDPFTAADFAVAVAEDDLCTVSDAGEFCPDDNVRWKSLHFEFGRCSLDALHGETWTDLVVGGITYELDLYRAFDCVGNGSPQDQYGWFLRRAP